MLNSKRIISTLGIVLCILLVLCGCNPGKTVKCGWDMVDLGDDVDIHTLEQGSYLADDYAKIASYAKGTQELSRPQSVQLIWLAEPQEQVAVAYYIVEIEDVNGLYAPISIDTATTCIDVFNLCVGTKYVWRVTANFADGRKSSSMWSRFTTKDVAPRNIYVDGVTNVRDLGGWATPEGKVRQGMMYRCGRLNKSETPDVIIEITQSGIDTMRNVLAIRTEIDLRTPNNHNTETGGITSSPLGEDVNYVNCPLEWDTGNYLTNNINSVREFFALAADINNYPLIFHCNIGTDRTGMFAFLINGLLGVAEEDLYRDYLFSNFGQINTARSLSNIKNNYLTTINKYQGATLSERIENCLIELVGVPQADIEAIKSIMLQY
ncbi:MAG: tyrosine-protein phosphatase [Clostridiales bacterium]|nr:tyrosine-protein phosphatase [Clostridiales bacterium]